VEGGHIFKERRLLRFCLWLLGTSQLLNLAKSKAMVNVHGICLYPWCILTNGMHQVIIHIGVGVWRCSFRQDGQCEGL